MDLKGWIFLLILVLIIGLGGYGLVTNTGGVGLLNALQQLVMGAYSSVLSFIVFSFALIVAVTLAWSALAKLFGSDPSHPGQDGAMVPSQAVFPVPSANQPAASAPSGRYYFQVALVITVLTWIVGGVSYGWHVLKLREDASSTYQSIVLTEGTPLPAFQGKHYSLRCIPVPELALVFKQGAVEDYRLIPLVGVGWESGHPVHILASLDSSHRIPDPSPAVDWIPRHPQEIQLLVRRIGPIPAPALQEFNKMKAPLAENAIMVATVATKDGGPILPDTAFEFGFMLVACGCVSVIASIWATVKWLRRRST